MRRDSMAAVVAPGAVPEHLRDDVFLAVHARDFADAKPEVGLAAASATEPSVGEEGIHDIKRPTRLQHVRIFGVVDNVASLKEAKDAILSRGPVVDIALGKKKLPQALSDACHLTEGAERCLPALQLLVSSFDKRERANIP